MFPFDRRDSLFQIDELKARSKGANPSVFIGQPELLRIYNHPATLLLKAPMEDEPAADGLGAAAAAAAASTPTPPEPALAIAAGGGGVASEVAAVTEGAPGTSEPWFSAHWEAGARAAAALARDGVRDLGRGASSAMWSRTAPGIADSVVVAELSAKVQIALHILGEAARAGEKTVLFSQSLETLSVLEEVLQRTRAPLDVDGCWVKGRDYLRMDGQTPSVEREAMLEHYNRPLPQPLTPPLRSPLLFLISTKAGGIGINLAAASRVILFDANWNPSYDAQASLTHKSHAQVSRTSLTQTAHTNGSHKRLTHGSHKSHTSLTHTQVPLVR